MSLLAAAAAIAYGRELEYRRRIRAQARAIESLNEIIAAITAQPDKAQEILHQLNVVVARMLQMPSCMFCLFKANENTIRVIHRFGRDAQPDRDTFPLDELPATREAFRTGQPVFTEDIEKADGPFDKQILRKYGVRALLILPLMFQGRPIGTLALSDTKPHKLTRGNLRMARLWASQAAVAVENSRLLEQTRRDAETRAMLLRELNHRVKNNLAGIAGLLSTSPPDLPPESRRWLNRVIDRIGGMARVHAMFLGSAGTLPLPELIRGTLTPMLAGRPPGVQVELDLTGDQMMLTSERAVTLSMAVHELCANALHHGVAGHGTIRVCSAVDQSGRATVVVIDDGSAARANGADRLPSVTNLESSGIGLNLVRGLVTRELRGEFTLEPQTHGGMRATISFGGLQENPT